LSDKHANENQMARSACIGFLLKPPPFRDHVSNPALSANKKAMPRKGHFSFAAEPGLLERKLANENQMARSACIGFLLKPPPFRDHVSNPALSANKKAMPRKGHFSFAS
jgi:hypothetical protein